ncbi:uncharacterized protein PSFLO_02340 [Pseudozyma flocculosa]|uniref:Uncharacterized protein n=1 Tax=Pseudozyma flocculosa TaxID=84751 RepID=A0A5C3F0B4_9BASI|nr:uncharacterized protein PSFLO_02340 [Pseudozyma flocculosa]
MLWRRADTARQPVVRAGSRWAGGTVLPPGLRVRPIPLPPLASQTPQCPDARAPPVSERRPHQGCRTPTCRDGPHSICVPFAAVASRCSAVLVGGYVFTASAMDPSRQELVGKGGRHSAAAGIAFFRMYS